MKKARNRMLAICLLILPYSCCLSAQESTSGISLSKQINNIKRTNEYVWAEASAESVPEAFDVANMSLVQHICNYISENGISQNADILVLKDKAAKCERIEMQRGDMYRVFVYIKKNDILQANSVETLTKEQLNAVVTSVEKQETALEREEKHSALPSVSNSNPENLKEWQSKLIHDLTTHDMVQDIILYLNKNMATGKVTRMGGNDDPVRNADKTFFITYNETGKVTALYGRNVNSKRFNYIDSSESTIDQYRNSKYIWFTLSN